MLILSPESRNGVLSPIMRKPKEHKKPITASEVIFGRRPIEELLRYQPDRLGLVFATVEGAAALGLDARGVKFKVVPAVELDRLSAHGVHQGIVAMLRERPVIALAEVLKELGGEGDPGLIVALDQVTDPHNVGAVLRAAEAGAVQAVIVPERRSSPVTATVIKSSAGASELVKVITVTNLARALEECKESGYWVVGADSGEPSTPLYRYRFPARTLIILGAEGAGLRRLTRELCDDIVSIPMHGKIDSLNVSQAASIFLYEFRRQQCSK